MIPEFIIVHHSASGWGCARIIDEWHRLRSPPFDCIGYHFVILNGYPNYEDFKMKRYWRCLDGQIEIGRLLDKDNDLEDNEVGAHALNFNKKSIGICLIHHSEIYTFKQREPLKKLLTELKDTFSISVENIKGHYEVNVLKPHCPGLDMNRIRAEIDV